ncbi:MAG: fumarate hydratase [Dehalococcoidales bacterium]|nr:fumarate hydratase [Dehalococcoidales bacterium]
MAVTISPDVLRLMKQAQAGETSDSAREMLKTQIENVLMAQKQRKPVCQSPGFPTAYIRYGGCVNISELVAVLKEEIVSATGDGFLRPSMVHPLTRKNSGDNSGIGVPNIELEHDAAIDFLEIIISFKGCGAELGNAVRIFTPAQIGENAAGIKEFVIDTVIKAGGKPCPPFAIGIGIGGQMDVAAKLSRRAVSIRKWDDRNPDPMLAALEEELLAKINQLGIGPGGIGGKTTALAVKIGMSHTHTAICPVAVNFYCWVARRAGMRIYPDGETQYPFDEEVGP